MLDQHKLIFSSTLSLILFSRFVESAMHYAKTKASFEEVTLKFMGIEEKNALTNYLKKKLESLR